MRQRKPAWKLLTSDEPGQPYRVQVLDRALCILDVVAEQGEMGAAQISTALQLHKSTVHRLLAVLNRNGYLLRIEANGKYALGIKMIELGTRAAARLDICELGAPLLDGLVEETGETAHIGVLSQGAVTSVAHSESHRTLRSPATVGRRTPAHCSSQGKVLLAALSPAALKEFVRVNGLHVFTQSTIRDLAVLEQELAEVRRLGYAVDNEEFEEGLKCIGAPVRDHTGEVIAAISIAGPALRLRAERMPVLVQAVRVAGERLSAALGHRPTSGAVG